MTSLALAVAAGQLTSFTTTVGNAVNIHNLTENKNLPKN